MGSAFHTFNIGRDALVQIRQTFPIQGTPIRSEALGPLESFEWDPVHSTKESVPINNGGQRILRDIPMGATGNLSFARTNQVGEQLELMIQENFFQGGAALLWEVSLQILAPYNPAGGVVTPSTPGSIEIKFIDAVLHMSKGGNYAGDEKTTQAFTFQSPRMVPGLNVPPQVTSVAAVIAYLQAQVARAHG